MKTNYFLLFFLIVFLKAEAQDIIVKKDGTTIMAKVHEIGTSEVKYKKWSNQNGPLYSILVSDLLAINYKNGEKETFENVNTSSSNIKMTPNSNGYIKPQAASNNSTIIKEHNQYLIPTEKVSKKTKDASGAIIVFNISPTSVLSTDKVEISFERTMIGWPNDALPEKNEYLVKIKNKTDEVLYFDKGTCFRQTSSGDTFCYYNNTQLSVNSSQNRNIGISAIPVFPVGIGGSSGSSYSTTSSSGIERVLAIPPHATVNFTEVKWIKTKRKSLTQTEEYESLEHAESFNNIEFGLSKGVVKRGEIKTFNLENSPFKLNYYFTFSTVKDFHEYSSLNVEMYISEIIGTSFWASPDWRPQKYIKNINSKSIVGSYEWF